METARPAEPAAWRPLPGFPAIRLRPLGPDDQAALERLGRSSDPEDLRLRFFHMIADADPRLLRRLTHLDPARELALIACEGESRTPIGVVRLHGDAAGETAEFAVLVRSDRQRQGLGRAMMEAIIAEARARGLKRLAGQILPENDRMLALARRLGFSLRATPEGVVEAALDLAPVRPPRARPAGRRTAPG